MMRCVVNFLWFETPVKAVTWTAEPLQIKDFQTIARFFILILPVRKHFLTENLQAGNQLCTDWKISTANRKIVSGKGSFHKYFVPICSLLLLLS